MRGRHVLALFTIALFLIGLAPTLESQLLIEVARGLGSFTFVFGVFGPVSFTISLWVQEKLLNIKNARGHGWRRRALEFYILKDF